jgi:hypothetical protein
MATPTYQSTTVTDFGVDATAHAVNMPATVTAGDLLLAFAAFDTTTSLPAPTGWTLIATNPVSRDPLAALYAKVAVGDEDGTTVDFASGSVTRGSVHVVRISSWQGSLDGGLRAAMASAGATNRAIGLSVGVTARDILWVAAQAKSSASVWGTTPTNYINETQTGVNEEATASGAVVTATRAASAAKEEIGTLWLVGSSVYAMLVAVLPA